jgi:chromosome segregation ATPase
MEFNSKDPDLHWKQIYDKLDLIINEINILKVSQERLIEEVKGLKENQTELNKSCSRMDSHISFVEETYQTLKNPLNIFKNKIEYVFGKKELK